ncbi:platelet endothelial aggregation receptor 1-like isoform X1 [Haliotis rufescens]|uniref:platelet endothelial aggregation receptor 1-like isoform X1 n=2 Tax=Haliotis rufescens TaxID=6454 RepID=UPI001EAFBB4C|nr:platelet endothelial aggregation receptor 1-like isoform X1 [Haliotis rufescens]
MDVTLTSLSGRVRGISNEMMLSLVVILLSLWTSTASDTSKVCPDDCLNSRCRTNNSRVVCTDGCVAGKRGDDCKIECLAACIQCERYTVGCVGSCRNPRFFGPNCSIQCAMNCMDGCNKTNGQCNGCKASYRGRYCNHTCPANCERCEQYGEGCIQCTEPYCRGLCDENMTNCDSTSCKKTCLPNCRSFDISSSKCAGPCINQNYRGAMCSIPCSPECDRCHKQTGECIQCIPRMWGRFCNESCPSRCRLCDRYSSTCIGSCMDSNFHGVNCDTPCPVNCHGCHRETGLCIQCANNFSRTYCDEICSPCEGETCNTSPCQERKANHTLVIVVGTIAGVSTLLLLILGIWAHRRSRLMRVYSSNTGGGRWDSNGSRQSRNSDYQSHKYSEIYDKDMDSDSCIPRLPPARLSIQPPPPPRKQDPTQKLPRRQSWSLGQGASRDSQTSYESIMLKTLHIDPLMAKGTESESLVTSEQPGVYDIASSPMKGIARAPSMPLLMTTSGNAAAEVSSRQHMQYVCDIHDMPVSSRIQQLTTKTSSILFIEQNNDLTNVTVKYLTPDKTVYGK